ncbi:hypothetical protein AB0M79_25435 [Polymorphospora sp. NPDC051019]|uniref:hypothetical protein n=1 Tax=Polymorphospora sp. NPDC051019 TaxID=3155725 RepID=UPI00341A8CFD
MRPSTANRDSRLLVWRHVREFAVPPSMIRSATDRRAVGDWAGACAAARVDVDLSLRSVAHAHGQELAARIRTDLRQLAPDLLRWHMPRVAPDGLLRPGLTISLTRYGPAEGADGDPVHLVARTPPAWADAGQRISLTLWNGSRPGAGRGSHPDRRFRLDLHRHLWDSRRAGELRTRAGADRCPGDQNLGLEPFVPPGHGYATERWADEAGLLLRAEGRTTGTVAVRIGARRRLLLDLTTVGNTTGGSPGPGITVAPAGGHVRGLPVLPDAATWELPDLALLRAGLIGPERLHPLVAQALVPDRPPADAAHAADGDHVPRLVECRGARHRIGLVDGVLVPLDHDPAEIRREELLAALTGTPLPCLQAIDDAHRHPECLVDVRARLDHGDIAGALAVVEAVLGPDALLRPGALRDELETAALRQVRHGLFRAGLAGRIGALARRPDQRRLRRKCRTHPRHALPR